MTMTFRALVLWSLCLWATSASVVISEIMYNGPLGAKQSYIELFNPDAVEVRPTRSLRWRRLA